MTFALALLASSLSWHEVPHQRLELRENNRPVLVYNYGPQLAEGVRERYRRSSYIHPVYAPNGVAVTDDFPADHFHHRGISWMWPVITYQGKRYDLWLLLPGIRHEFVRWIARENGNPARLSAENAWFIGDRRVLKETVDLRVHPARGNAQAMDITLVFEALEPLTLRGEPTDNKGYGGLSVRFAPRKDTVITGPDGREPSSDRKPLAWAELAGAFEKGNAALRIDIAKDNPGFPNGWCLRDYGYLGVNYPQLETLALEPGKPLRLSYRITVEGRQ
ncbi:MAG TPA: hypothetical protein DEH78_21960 [Solibacterales bacterium]|nr:hypothetical protein [Bryobacterales bacterium]